MEFAESLSALALKVRNQKQAIQTEEGTKNAFVMPFISTILGYDVFNPLEVVPESRLTSGSKRARRLITPSCVAGRSGSWSGARSRSRR